MVVEEEVVGEDGMVGDDVRVGVDHRTEVFLGCCSIRCSRLHSYALSLRSLH